MNTNPGDLPHLAVRHNSADSIPTSDPFATTRSIPYLHLTHLPQLGRFRTYI